MAEAPIPRVAAAIAYADLSGAKHGWANPAELWADLEDGARRDYRAQARAAVDAYQSWEREIR